MWGLWTEHPRSGRMIQHGTSEPPETYRPWETCSAGVWESREERLVPQGQQGSAVIILRMASGLT